jgi:hypothetical protein
MRNFEDVKLNGRTRQFNSKRDDERVRCVAGPPTMGARPNCLSAHHFFQFTISCPSCRGLFSANELLTEENAASTAAENFRPFSLIA